MDKTTIIRMGLGLVMGLYVLARNLPGALLCLWPGLMRSRPLPASALEEEDALLAQVDEELGPLGFERLGAHSESPPLGRRLVCFDYANEATRTYATVYRLRKEVRLYFLSVCESGAMVLTANHKRPGAERPDYLSGGLEEAKPDNLLAAHVRRVERMKESGRPMAAAISADARASASASWFTGHGSRETRLRNVTALILTLMALYILGSVVYLGVFKQLP